LTDTLNNTSAVLFGSIYQKIDFQVRGVAQLGSGANAVRNPLPESLVATVRPCRTVRSEPRTVGVSAAQDASLRAEPNRLMPPISASRTSAVNGPTPGSWVRTSTRGSDRAWPGLPGEAVRPG
jgi:hypothetical protein